MALSATGQPAGVTVSFTPASIAAPGSGTSTMSMVVASTTATGTYPITVTGTGGGVTQSTTVTLSVNSVTTPDFSLSASPNSLAISRGHHLTTAITVTPSNGFSSAVALSASGQPAGVTVSFTPASVAAGAGTSTMFVAVISTATPGTYPITVTGSGGGLIHTTTVTLDGERRRNSQLYHFGVADFGASGPGKQWFIHGHGGCLGRIQLCGSFVGNWPTRRRDCQLQSSIDSCAGIRHFDYHHGGGLDDYAWHLPDHGHRLGRRPNAHHHRHVDGEPRAGSRLHNLCVTGFGVSGAG